VLAIDALRGFDMFWLIGGKSLLLALAAVIAVPDPEWFSSMVTPASTVKPEFALSGLVPVWLRLTMEHTQWGGFSFWDLIMPLFLFIIGAAMPFSFERAIEQGASKRTLYLRMARRFVLLSVLGMIVQGNLLQFDLSKLRVCTVLGTLACGYVITGLVLLHVPRRFYGWITAGLLIGYWLAMTLIPVPGLGVGVLEEHRNLAAWIDHAILGRFHHGARHTYFLTIMTFSATVMLGMQAGQLLKSQLAPRQKLMRLAASGVGCLVLGWVWSFWFPINKPIWSSSMVLWSGGWCLLLLASFYGLIDVLGWHKWAFPFVVIGANSLFAYVVPHVFDNFGQMAGKLVGGLARHVGPYGPSLRAAAAAALVWLILYYMYRKKTFLRV
jgi:predicted acyltransferase